MAVSIEAWPVRMIASVNGEISLDARHDLEAGHVRQYQVDQGQTECFPLRAAIASSPLPATAVS